MSFHKSISQNAHCLIHRQRQIFFVLVVCFWGSFDGFSQIPNVGNPTLQNQQTRTSVNLSQVAMTELERAEKIVKDALALAKATETKAQDLAMIELKKANIGVVSAAKALKNVLNLSDSNNYALLKANYTAEDAVKGFFEAYRPDRTRFFTVLRARESESFCAKAVKTYFNPTFEELRVFLNPFTSPKSAFILSLGAFGYTHDQTVQTCFHYFSGGFINISSQPYPNVGEAMSILSNNFAADVANSYHQWWALLMSKGYTPNDIIAAVPIINLNANGSARDALSQSFKQAYPSVSGNPKITIQFTPTGEVSLLPTTGRNCFKQFIEKLRQSGVPKDKMTTLLNACFVCSPSTNVNCNPETTKQVNQLLSEAGYR